MTNKKDINNHISWFKKHYQTKQEPIFEIILFENTHDKISQDNNSFPDTGIEDWPGFYYELDIAIKAMNENWADIQDHTFYTGFILCHFPGLYQCAGTEARMYFVWDEKKQGFFQQEEPKIFEHIAY